VGRRRLQPARVRDRRLRRGRPLPDRRRTAALLTAIGLAVAALFAVGATIGAVNGRPVLRSGLRQVIVGALAAGVTFGVGHLIGTSIS
jgi:VIT1/CCC1 family predicted Fe2+/Mn2+ transporter